jgi:hypothetical protein
MKYLFLSFYFICLLSLFGCGGASSVGKKQSMTDTSHFYPLKAYFQVEGRDIAAHRVQAYIIRITDGHKDSLSLSQEALRAGLQVFTDRAIPDTAHTLYRESVFEDLGTESITLNYSPVDASKVTVQQVDILLNPTTQQIKRVFIRSVYPVKDTLVREQCSWKTGNTYEINREKTWPGSSIHTELQSVHWQFE